MPTSKIVNKRVNNQFENNNYAFCIRIKKVNQQADFEGPLPFSDEVIRSLDVLDELLVPHDDVEGNDFKDIRFRGRQTKAVEIELKIVQVQFNYTMLIISKK